jgi:hypothetical protein
VERVDAWIEALPGTKYMIQAIDLAPLALILAVGVGVLLGFAPVERVGEASAVPEPRRRWSRSQLGRTAARLVLTAATPALALSLLGLFVQIVAPARLARLLEPLPGDAYVRLLLTLAPLALLAVFLLSLLYLLGPLDPGRTQPVRTAAGGPSSFPSRPRFDRLPAPAVRSDLAIIVLVVGLVVAAAAGALLVVGVLVLLVVR